MKERKTIFDQYKKKLALEDSKWNDYISRFQRMEVPAKTILLHEGNIAAKLFFIEKGCIRVWYNKQGKDITTQFFFENNMVSSIVSFKNNMPSLVNIETIEPSIVWFINKPDLEQIVNEILEVPHLRELYINGIFERTFNYMQYSFSFIKDTPLERYENLLKEKPYLVQRVPQHYIASYLGISKVHLSRIKNQLYKRS